VLELACGGVAELADAADSKSAGALLRVGSSPSTATIPQVQSHNFHTSRNPRVIKHIAWALFFVASSGLAMWTVLVSTWTLETHPIGTGFLLVYFVAAPLGAFWMLLDGWKHDGKLTPKLALSFVPYGFVYYYVYYVRTRTRPKGPWQPRVYR
jgi:hypothetical protein